METEETTFMNLRGCGVVNKRGETEEYFVEIKLIKKFWVKEKLKRKGRPVISDGKGTTTESGGG